MISFDSTVPVEIVRRLLMESGKIADRASALSQNFIDHKKGLRKSLIENDILFPFKAPDSTNFNSCSAIDGSMVLSKKGLGDVLAAAAVEAPYHFQKTETYHSEKENCEVWIDVVPRSSSNTSALGAIMSLMEIKLAAQSQSDLVLIDGSFISTLVNVVTGIAKIPDYSEADSGIDNGLKTHVSELLHDIGDKVLTLLTSGRHIAVPKYSTTNELQDISGINLDGLSSFDAKTLFSIALEADEVSLMFPVKEFNNSQKEKFDKGFNFGPWKKDIFECLDHIHTFYYKPWPWSTAIRIDVPGVIDDSGLQNIMSAVKIMTRQPDILEPIPLYFADRWAKTISDGVTPAIQEAALAQIKDPELRMMFALDYRTT